MKKESWFNVILARSASKQAFLLLDPVKMMRNPVMFITEIGAILTTVSLFIEIFNRTDQIVYTLAVVITLWSTVLFANFAEAIAEARGKSQANSLKQTRKSTTARRISNGFEEFVNSEDLKTHDVVLVQAQEVVPSDGEIIAGAATIDESAITGESAPVVREAGGDRSGVTGGTRVLSDEIKVRITVNPGDSFLDRMISLVEGTIRQKTPNEVALTVTLAGLTLAFLMVTLTLYPIGTFFGVHLSIPTLIALLVCLIPTTIGALLVTIGLAGMDRAFSANVLAKSGKAVELAGDIDTLLLDKTGTITMGNRQASEFYPLPHVNPNDLIRAAVYSSYGDETPEGRSIVDLGKKKTNISFPENFRSAEVIKFSAETRISGLNSPEHQEYRKGASDAIINHSKSSGNPLPSSLQSIVDRIAEGGKTPIVVAENGVILGVVALSDILKPGIQDRFERLRAMGLRVVMVTGDNPLTAKAIAHQAGVDDYIAEAKPEDKLQYIRQEQRQGHLVAMMGDGTNDAPALAQADIGVAMNSGTQAAKEAANLVDLDSDPTKLIEIIEIGKQLLMTRGALTTFSLANDIAKYFALIPAMFMLAIPQLSAINIMRLSTPNSAILSALIFNALIIPILIPIALKGVQYKPMGAEAILKRNLMIYGLGGVISPFIGIKLIDLCLHFIGIV